MKAFICKIIREGLTYSSVFLSLLILISHTDCHAQKPLELTIGARIPDLNNIGIRYSYQGIKVGLNLGFVSNEAIKGETYGLDFHTLIGNKYSDSLRSNWFVNLSVSHLKYVDTYSHN